MTKLLLFLFFLISVYIEAVEFVLFTQPKTGTHLLIPILTELTRKNVYWASEYTTNMESNEKCYPEIPHNPEHFFFTLNETPWNRQTVDLVWSINNSKGTFLHLHAPYSSAMENYLIEKGCINFFIRRDPRDQIVSLLNHYKNIHFNDKFAKQLSSDDEILLYMIKKESKLHTIHYMEWLKSPICCVLDFAKLMGAHGGSATHADAIGEMRKIAEALRLNLSDSSLEEVYQRHFGKGWSFFKGKVGVWKNYFKAEHKAAIKNEIGDLLIQLGFEKDNDW